MAEYELWHGGREEVVPLLRAAVLYTSKYELLPEILDIFGDSTFLKFLDIFAGRVIRVPTRKEVADVIRDVGIWMALSNPDPLMREAKEAEYVGQFGFTRTRLRKIHEAMDDVMNGMGIELRQKDNNA